MWPVSEQFAAAMMGSHTLLERATVIDPTGETIEELRPTAGQVVESAGALVRHSGSLTIPGDVRPLLGRHARVLLEVGVRHADGEEEWIPEMTGHVAAREFTGGETRVELRDRMMRAQRGRLLTTVIPGSTPAPEAAYRLLLAADPGMALHSQMSSPWVVPRLVIDPLQDMAEQAAQTAEGCGAVVWVDRLDGAVISPRPSASNPPVMRLRESDAVVTDVSVVEPENRLPNIVIVTSRHSAAGQHQGTAVMGDWEDNPIVWEVETDRLVSQVQATEMAQSLLLAAQAGSEEIVIEVATAMAHLMAGDVVDLDLPTWGVHAPAVLYERRRNRGRSGATLTFRRGVQFDAA